MSAVSAMGNIPVTLKILGGARYLKQSQKPVAWSMRIEASSVSSRTKPTADCRPLAYAQTRPVIMD
ncbi:hypothetical protein BM221_010478 [Beauveria bassiana]|uniref:Uncharacterized protein n=1 Tax=Beauveria bassiana TaxID=176275 RepID=A0A2N6N900_BEABA|nr:hypothetical protein BM221_010478 [Beauveria bassiana]